VDREITAFDLPLEGALPPELVGLYVREQTLDGMEFPRVADARVGRKNRFAFCVHAERGPRENPRFAGLIKLDLASGRSEFRDVGRSRLSGEFVCVPTEAADPDSDEG
jgi:carotenoid cleavage dioxygenase-like enzyme